MRAAIPSLVGFAKAPWNKGRLTGQKRPLKPKEVWTIRVRLQLEQRRRDLALFNLAIDSKLRGCDLVRLRVSDVCVGGRVQDRATVIQRKTSRPVQFEITEQTRAAILEWLAGTPWEAANTCSRAAFMTNLTSRHGNTLGSSVAGLSAPVLMARPTEPTQCAAPRRHRSTRRPATCEWYSCCSGTRSLKVPSVTSVSRSTMRLPSLNRSKSDLRRMRPCLRQGRNKTDSGLWSGGRNSADSGRSRDHYRTAGVDPPASAH
jgi:hypothetical protein